MIPFFNFQQGERSVEIAQRKNYAEIVELLENPPPRVIDVFEKDSGKGKKKRSKESGTSKDSKDSGSRHKDRHKKVFVLCYSISFSILCRR